MRLTEFNGTLVRSLMNGKHGGQAAVTEHFFPPRFFCTGSSAF